MEVTILLSIVTALVVEAYKVIQKKYGDAASKRVIYLGVFGLSLLWTILRATDIVSMEFIKEFSSLMLMAVGFYEVIIKYVKQLLPDLNTRNKK